MKSLPEHGAVKWPDRENLIADRQSPVSSASHVLLCLAWLSPAHLHASQIHGLVHQDPCGRLEARRDGHGAFVCDEAVCLWVNLLDVQASQ